MKNTNLLNQINKEIVWNKVIVEKTKVFDAGVRFISLDASLKDKLGIEREKYIVGNDCNTLHCAENIEILRESLPLTRKHKIQELTGTLAFKIIGHMIYMT